MFMETVMSFIFWIPVLNSMFVKGLIRSWSTDTVYLYITSCHPEINEEDIEEHLSDIFENVSNVKAHKTMTHNYYTSLRYL